MSYSIIKKLVFLFIFTIISYDNSPAQDSIDHIVYQSIKLRTPEELADIEGPSDWRTYQGNEMHTGYNEKDMITIPLTLKWSRQFQTEDIYQPIIVGNRLIWSSLDYWGDNPISGLMCVKANNGDTLWFFPSIYNVVSQASYAYGNLYFQNYYHIRCLDIISGDMIWSNTYRSQAAVRHLCPSVDNGMVFLNGGFYGGMYKYDAFNGEYKWRILLPSSFFWCPTIYHNSIYIFIDKLIRAYDFYSSDLFWSLIPSFGDMMDELNSAPIIDTTQEIMYCINNGVLAAVDLNTQEFLWQRAGHYTCYGGHNPVLYKDLIIAIDSCWYLRAFNALTGEIVKERNDIYSSYDPVAANGLLFISHFNYTYAIDIETWEPVWKCDVGGRMAIANNNLFIATKDGWIYVYEPVITDVGENNSDDLPEDFILNQNYPNPFNSSTIIEFEILSRSNVIVKIYNSLGQSIKILINESVSAGQHTLYWDGTDNNGNVVSTGVYFYQIEAGDIVQTKKMLLLK